MSAAIDAADRDVRVIVLTGEGRAFCSGADMSALEGPPEALMGSSRDMRPDRIPDHRTTCRQCAECCS